jgi:two-component system response regulator YesN
MYSNNLVCDILEYINKNINKEITIEELANRFYYDKTYIMKRFKKEIGKSIHEYINIIRILNSLDYFKYDNYVLSIALKNGFNSIEYYSEIFKKVIGVNPQKYKKFINRSIDINEKEIDIIIKKINECNNLKLFVNNYLSRKKPSRVMEKVYKL